MSWYFLFYYYCYGAGGISFIYLFFFFFCCCLVWFGFVVSDGATDVVVITIIMSEWYNVDSFTSLCLEPAISEVVRNPINSPPLHSSSLHKSSGCILKGAKIFTLSKVVKGFCVHTGADKEEAPSARPKENCWNKSAHTKTQRDNGAGAGPDPETETHSAPEHTDTYTHTHWESARLGTKSAHRLIFIFGAHIVQDIQYQKTENIITPPVCNLAVNPMPESNK